MNRQNKDWSKITRYLHGAMALTLIIQLLLSLVLAPPDELDNASELARMAMEGHEVIGLLAVAILFLHWIWIFISSDLHFSNLFPLSSDALTRVFDDIRYLVKNKTLAPAETHGGLAGFIHGIGFIVATLVAATGFGLYVVMDFMSQGFENPLFEEIAEVHELFGNLMWIYLILHVVAAAWHQYSGDRIISCMFRLKETT